MLDMDCFYVVMFEDRCYANAPDSPKSAEDLWLRAQNGLLHDLLIPNTLRLNIPRIKRLTVRLKQ